MALVSASCRATPSSIKPLGSHRFMRVKSPSRWLTSGATIAGVVFDLIMRLGPHHGVEDAAFAHLGLGGGKDLIERLGEVLGQALLGDVAGRSLFEGADGEVLAAVGGHQDDGRQRILGAHGLDQFQAVHLRHEHVGKNDVGRHLGNNVQGFDAVAGEEGLPALGLLNDGAGQPPVHRGVVHHEHGVDRKSSGRPRSGRRGRSGSWQGLRGRGLPGPAAQRRGQPVQCLFEFGHGGDRRGDVAGAAEFFQTGAAAARLGRAKIADRPFDCVGGAA